MKRFKVGPMSTLLCLGAAACAPSGPPITVNAAELAGAYLSNAPEADARFRGHPLIVTGVSGGVDASKTLTLIPGVLADLSGDASSISFGMKVTVNCDSVSSDGTGVHLKVCTVGDAHVITLEESAADIQAMYNEDLAEQQAGSR